MRYPQGLKLGDTIGFVAPSFGASIEPYASCLTAAQDTFQNMGYKTYEYPCSRKSDGFGISTKPTVCAQEFEDAWGDRTSQVLMSCGGGELMCEVMTYVDFESLKEQPPKWFMGYSDNTNLVHTLVTLTDTAAIYGPCAPAFGMRKWHKSLDDAVDVLAANTESAHSITTHSYNGWQMESLKDELHPFEPYNIDMSLSMKGYIWEDGIPLASHDIQLEGRLLGGCVDCLSNLVGTRLDKTAEFASQDKDGILWMLETCELSPMDMRRSLWQMHMAGWFTNAKGFIFGRPDRYGDTSFGKSFEEVVLGFFEEFEIHCPCIFDADFGHKPPMIPVIMGSLGSSTFQDGALSITMRFV